VRGFADPFAVPVAGDANRTIWSQWSGTEGKARSIAPFHLSTRQDFNLMRMAGTPHNWTDAQHAWDHGRMAHWPEAKTERAMGYYRREDMPFQFALADAFTICDAYHCSMQTGTNSNRLYLWSGTNDGAGRHGGPSIDNSHDSLPKDGGAPDSYRWTTYVERLQKAGIDWRLYQDMADNFTDNPLVGFATFRAAASGAPGSDPALKERALTTHSLDRLRADVVAGTLPQVSYIIATARGSEHPGPSSPAQGAAYTADVLDALTANPAIWARTALFVMFDENDGFFDHVPPPAPPSRDGETLAGASTVDTTGEYHLAPSTGDKRVDLPELRGRPYGLGPRVPCYVVSPWSRGGWINSQTFDHTSVIRFLEARFGVMEPNISPWRRAVCGDLTSAFDFTSANAALASLADPRPDALRAAAIKGQIAPLAPADPTQLWQEPGTRPNRPLPYDFDVVEAANAPPGQFGLDFRVRSGSGVVFHVYDRHALDAIPRRYTVTPGKGLTGLWSTEEGYDLWVLGPNGFHRLFTGGGIEGAAAPAVQWRFDARRMTLTIVATTAGITVTPNGNADQHPAWRADKAGSHTWSLAKTGGLYDLTITADADPLFIRRLAGRVEAV
jgi:phospholipase C